MQTCACALVRRLLNGEPPLLLHSLPHFEQVGDVATVVVLRRASNQACMREKVCWLISPLSPSLRDIFFLPFCRCGDGGDSGVQVVSLR